MAYHHARAAGVYIAPERKKIDAVETRASMVHMRNGLVRIGRGVAMARKMFRHSLHAAVFQTLRIGNAETCHTPCIFAERTLAYDRI